ncbi:hypothetical protein KDN24_20570 [Bacillus sp. Bva_UNVM-123]|uniref:hypothetical protein n=1 Tax=Bacillus sp. Bva_UNVM-123 TaxID=2829798 RepID=UPI00391F4CE4
MSIRVLFLLIGFGLAVSGGISTIVYLNVLSIGLDFTEYLYFIAGKMECYLLPIGIIVITLAIYLNGYN